MRRITEIEKDQIAMSTLVELTSIFEGMASMKISQVKDQVFHSNLFFKQLWAIYSQVNVGDEFKFGRVKTDSSVIQKELFVVITSEGAFSGDIDQKLVNIVIKDFNKAKNDIIVIGHHGAMQLAQQLIPYQKYYKLPSKDRNINVAPIIKEIKRYKSTKVYYQEYVSLMVQDVKRIELSHAITEQGQEVENNEDIINERTYIFEPSTYEVTSHLESSMMQVAISQLILNSKLAQYASRFQSMRSAHQRSDEIKRDNQIEYNRAKRSIKDERLKEIVNGMKKARPGQAKVNGR